MAPTSSTDIHDTGFSVTEVPLALGGSGVLQFQALWSEAAEVARLFAIASRTAFDNRERLGQLRTLLEGARKELTGMIYGTGQSESKSSAPDVEQA